jgi:hypothetical protein
MSDELVVPHPIDQLPAQASLQQLLTAALLDERIVPDKLKELLAIAAEREYNEAFARLQPRLPVIKRKRRIEVKGKVRSRYAAYEDIDKQIRPLYTAEGFSIKYDAPIKSKNEITVNCWVKHSAGHKELTQVTLPLDESEFRNVVQNYGATITFAKRYALTLALNITTEDEDNDAEGLSHINERELAQLEDMMADCGITRGSELESRFLSKLTVKTLSDLTRGQPFDIAMTMLRSYRKKLGIPGVK